MSRIPAIFVFTHDSIGLGEDGPTHQPVEHLAALRAIPGLTVIRPADERETFEAWETAISAAGPTALVLTRQKVPVLDRRRQRLGEETAPGAAVARGAYVLSAAAQEPEALVLLASGSEVALCLAAQAQLEAEGIGCRVVSMPSWELFEAQPEAYRRFVLPPGCRARVAVEAAIPQGWERYTGGQGAVIGMRGFGASAPAGVLFERFGFTVEAIVARARRLLAAQTAVDSGA
jgi:transketolase